MIKYSFVITTYNRLKDLKKTLKSLENILNRKDVELLICNDASSDGTKEFLNQYYSNSTLIHNKKSKSLIHNRNVLNNKVKGEYIISLDDDANFLSENVLEEIDKCFVENPKSGVQNLRIFWGKENPIKVTSTDNYELNKGFVGCGHVWRKTAWNSILNYPAWFVFYGEEEFASFQLFKKGWQVLYNPKVLVHHRVDIKSRKKQKDYRVRLRRSLRSGWYLYFLFYPINKIPKLFVYTLWVQIKKKTFKGDIKATIAITQALFDLVYNIPKLIRNANRLTPKEFKEYKKLPDTKLYWKPKKTV
ncbi:glycosyltransferase family 2 protein [Polaribacter sargassicola]|uniref:glycosyltransferase family 2 protein n=1 Tax=Polaribacter sargassicola TaxID=2836891 RepID=UPI001F3C4C92|nr:glycosyltransferase [Polaribacter sp. DS7-9]MCG1036603.1 glycosyltransferase [Polaribacter sp. DS7-9]